MMSGKNESLRLAPDQTRHGFADLLSDLCGCWEATLPVGFGFQLRNSRFSVSCGLRDFARASITRDAFVIRLNAANRTCRSNDK